MEDKQKKYSKFKLFIIFFILANMTFYEKERFHWINDEHSNLKAKEYYILGDMVFFYRKVLNIFFVADSPVMLPLNNLQELIYNEGIKYLPKDDGEIAIWRYKFFLYFYVRRNYLPEQHLDNSKIISQKRVKVLDDMYEIIETLATKDINDSEMNQMKYKIFPLLVSSYGLGQGNYFGSKSGYYKIKKLMQSKKHMIRMEKIIDWLIKFKSEWSDELKNSIEKYNPMIVVAHYFALIDLTERIIDKDLTINGVFRCDNPYINLYIKSRKEIYGDGENTALFRLKKGQDKMLYRMIFTTHLSKSLVYLIHNKCNINFDTGYPNEEFIKIITSKFKKQIKIKRIEK